MNRRNLRDLVLDTLALTRQMREELGYDDVSITTVSGHGVPCLNIVVRVPIRPGADPNPDAYTERDSRYEREILAALDDRGPLGFNFSVRIQRVSR